MAKQPKLEIRTESSFRRMTRKVLLPVAFATVLVMPSAGCALLNSIQSNSDTAAKQCPGVRRPTDAHSPNPYTPGSACWQAYDDLQRSQRAYRWKYGK